jgi:hypothetical protein
MTKFLAGILSVIAVGVLLIAYGLLSPRVAAFDPRAGMDRFARPTLASEQIPLGDDPMAARYAYMDRMGAPVYAAPAYAAPVYSAPAPSRAPYGYSPNAAPHRSDAVRPVRTVSRAPASAEQEAPRTVERRSGRNWKKTAIVIGGSSAAGAGLGAIFGGKKGALIGAAIGGGASTVYETTRK